ncbi:hypothetical protein [Ralstonia sp. 1138]|uniref:hypothetical protein n=1 Tax=Ralstonia sp. 1138 TaxID=3156423 RepID=UPI00339A5A62
MRARIWVMLFLLGFTPFAHAAMNAGELAQRCRNGGPLTTVNSSSFDWAVCGMMLGAYRDGFVEGTYQGLMRVYLDDKQVMMLVEGGKDMQRRAGAILPRARCSVDDSFEAPERLRQAYLSYIAAHPEASGKAYPEALRAAIETVLCQR